MSPIIVSAPVTPPEIPPVTPPPVVHGQTGFGFELIGTDGTVWDLAAGPVYALAGLEGAGAPDVDHWLREYAAFDGSMHQGLRVPARTVSLPVEVREVNELDWLASDQLLWKGLDPKKDAYLRITSPLGESRYLPMRYTSGGGELEIDPMLDQMSVYPLQFTVPDPAWRGPDVQAAFAVSAEVPFFPGPPFTINPSATIGSATVSNPGDYDSYAKYVIDGPYTDVTVGIGTAVVTFDVPILAGEKRIVDMDPKSPAPIVTGTGADAWLDAAEIEFAPIPPGEDIPLNLSVSGAAGSTKIEVSLPSRHRRAW